VRVRPGALAELAVAQAHLRAPRVVFVCTNNSARSQLASALWARSSSVPVAAAGTHPAETVHRRAIAVARRHGVSLDDARTADVSAVLRPGDLVVAVCDSAHEELDPAVGALHWSVPDPVRVGTAAAFEQAYAELRLRVDRLAGSVEPG
jgi:protein-tyrosine-phosphatase